MKSSEYGNISSMKTVLLAAVMVFAVCAESGYGQASVGKGVVAPARIIQSTTNTTSGQSGTTIGSVGGYNTESIRGPMPGYNGSDIDSMSNSGGGSQSAGGAVTGSSQNAGATVEGSGGSAGMSDTALNGTGYGSTDSSTGPPPPPIGRAFIYAASVEPTDYLFLCLSIISCVVAFFMLYQSVALQRMLTKGHENAPAPDSGKGISWLLFWLVSAICGFYWIANAQRQIGSSDLPDFFRRDWWCVALWSPRTIAYIVLIASVAPGVIAIYKFALAIGWLLFRYVRTRGMARFASSALTKVDAASTLERIEENINSLKSKFSAFENQSTAAGRGNRTLNDEIEKKRLSEIDPVIGYVFAFTVLFVVVHIAFSWGVVRIQGWKVVWVAAFDFVIMMLVSAFILRKLGKITEQSYMKIFFHSLKLIFHSLIGSIRRDKALHTTPERSQDVETDPSPPDSDATKMEASSKTHTSGKV